MLPQNHYDVAIPLEILKSLLLMSEIVGPKDALAISVLKVFFVHSVVSFVYLFSVLLQMWKYSELCLELRIRVTKELP